MRTVDNPAWPEIARWITWMRAQAWSERTVIDRACLVERVARRSGVAPAELSVDDVLAFLSQQSMASTSRQTYHSSLASWFRWLQESGQRVDNPMDQVRKPRAGRREAKSLTREHLRQLLASRIHKRTRTMILLAAYQGLRVSEVAKVRGSEIDLVSHELHVVGKGDVHSVLPLHPLIELEAKKYGPAWWFPQHSENAGSEEGGHVLGSSVSTIVGTAMRRAGLPGSAHSLRHWHATELLRSGVDSRVTQELMRHASLATTQRYMHVDDSQRRAGLLLLPDVTV
jgi:integrase/recombinase XerD